MLIGVGLTRFFLKHEGGDGRRPGNGILYANAEGGNGILYANAEGTPE